MGSLPAPACEYLICMMVMMSMMPVATAMVSMFMMMAMNAFLMPVAAAVVSMFMVMTTFFMSPFAFQKFFYLSPVFKRATDSLCTQFLSWGRDNCSLFIFPAKHMNTFFNFLIRHHLRPADDNRRRMLYLILKKLSEIFKV